jgi:nucleoid DNA-binding protein
MNKKDLINRVYNKYYKTGSVEDAVLSKLYRTSPFFVATFVDRTLKELKKMVNEEEVRIRGFGTFKKKRRNQYTIYPPGGPKTVPAREIVKFKCSRNFFEEGVNEDKV